MGRSKPLATYVKSGPREWFESIATAVILALFVRTFVLQTFKIPSGSMEQTLLIGDHLIVDKFKARPFARGQILVFKSPEEPEKDLIKRVVALPGDTVELKGTTLLLNGQALTEPYAHYLDVDALAQADPRRSYGPVTVPADHLLMMGDNRDNSRDGRFFGFLPMDYVRGRALFVYMSFGESAGSIRWGRIFHQLH